MRPTYQTKDADVRTIAKAPLNRCQQQSHCDASVVINFASDEWNHAWIQARVDVSTCVLVAEANVGV